MSCSMVSMAALSFGSVFAAGVIGTGCTAEAPVREQRQGDVSVILYLVDTLRADRLGAYAYD